MIYNNAFTAFDSVAVFSDYRHTNNYGAPYFLCDGSGPFDQNTPGQGGWLCVDQVGAGQSRNLGGADFPTGGKVQNAHEPVYVWGNSGTTSNGSPIGDTVGSQTGNIQIGRDVIVGTPRPGYQPFVYPHPLVSGSPAPSPSTGGSTPPPPQNLRILSGAF